MIAMTNKQQHDGPQGTRIIDLDKTPVATGNGVSKGASEKSASLIGLNELYKNQYFYLRPPQITIGRDDKNDMVLKDQSVSSQHARITYENKQWKIVNLLSSNGTFVNDRKVSQYKLNHGDLLRFGSLQFRFETAAGKNKKSGGKMKWIYAGALVAAATIVAYLVK